MRHIVAPTEIGSHIGNTTTSALARMSRAAASPRALGALAVGAVAFGALAVGAFAIGKLVIGRARVKRLDIDELVVRSMRVTQALQLPSQGGSERPG